MSNILKMIRHDNKNVRIFAETILSLSTSKGFYGRMVYNINSLSEEGLEDLCADISAVDFNDAVDVVLYLEA